MKERIEAGQEQQRALVTQCKDLKEDIVTLQIREMDITEKKNILEKKLEIPEAETLTVISQLEIANRCYCISNNKKRSYGVNSISSHEVLIIFQLSTLCSCRRIEDLQLVLNCDSDSACSSLCSTEQAGQEELGEELDIFLQNHRRRMMEQKEEERKIREGLKQERRTGEENFKQEGSHC